MRTQVTRLEGISGETRGLIVPILLNGTKMCSMAIDTMASHSFIDPKVFDFPEIPGEELEMHTAFGFKKCPKLDVKTLTFDEHEFQIDGVYALSLPGQYFSGLLGWDILDRFKGFMYLRGTQMDFYEK